MSFSIRRICVAPVWVTPPAFEQSKALEFQAMMSGWRPLAHACQQMEQWLRVRAQSRPLAELKARLTIDTESTELFYHRPPPRACRSKLRSLLISSMTRGWRQNIVHSGKMTGGVFSESAGPIQIIPCIKFRGNRRRFGLRLVHSRCLYRQLDS